MNDPFAFAPVTLSARPQVLRAIIGASEAPKSGHLSTESQELVDCKYFQLRLLPAVSERVVFYLKPFGSFVLEIIQRGSTWGGNWLQINQVSFGNKKGFQPEERGFDTFRYQTCVGRGRGHPNSFKIESGHFMNEVCWHSCLRKQRSLMTWKTLFAEGTIVLNPKITLRVAQGRVADT